MHTLSKLATRSLILLAPSAVISGATATSVNALTIDDTFLTSITGSGNAAAIESAIQTASNTIASLYSNPVTINIVFGTSNIGGGESEADYYSSAYSNYVALLNANSAANPANTTLTTAIANLGSGNGANVPNATVAATAAHLQALGVNVAGGFDQSGNFNGTGSYDGVVTIGSSLFTTPAGNLPQAIAIYVAEHEIDEILGGGGAGSVLGQSGLQAFCTTAGGTCYGALDLYRYSAPGVPSFTPDTSATSYFSINGGVTNIENFNQSGNGSDYADWLINNNFCLVQSAFVCNTNAGGELYTATSPEYTMMESIGYDPVATPLPSSWLMLVSGFVGLGFFAYRGKQKFRSSAVAGA
jgi:Teneurin Intracellular Region